MNTEHLLAHYEKIADAPDAIARLRRFILDLAVRGKLVPQDAGDEPTSELLTQIAKEKARLVKAGEIRKDKPLPPVDEEADFDVPPTWQWTRLGVVTSYIQRGRSPKYAASDGSLVVSQKCVQWRGLDLAVAKQITSESLADYEDVRFLRDGDLLWNSTGTGTIGRVIRLVNPPAKLVCDSHVTVVRCLEVDPEYIRTWLRSDHVYSLIEDRAAGSTNQVELTAQMAINQVVPLPPLAEQHRIVAKVDELMGLCDRLEAARARREAVRDRLAAASLARLNAPDPETFQADARFALQALTAVTTRPDQIKALRQTILNLAVRGKLVPQDANDEPASDLLKRIATEKAQGVKEGKARRQDSLPKIDLEQAPFELPSGWTWGRFPEVGTFGRGKSKHRPRNDPALFNGGEHLMIQTGDVARSQGVIETYTNKYNDFGLSQSFKWPKGTLCITIAANIADSGILSFDACFPDSVVGFIPASMFENARYFEYFVRTAKANLLEFAPATAQKNINLEILTQVLIPLPPLAEQHRIVTKVDALMALCDRLEASLTATAATHRRLLDALLAEALAPTDARPSDVSDRQTVASADDDPEKVIFAERSAYILSLAYVRHRFARRERTFGHVKAQKILHLVEAEAGFDLGRAPMRDAAGPNDFKHMLAVEQWAREHERFVFENNGAGYVLRQLSDFDKSLATEHGPEPSARAIATRLIDLFVPMDTRQAEIFATVYSAWNNLLIEGQAPTDTEIVWAARDGWHPDKLKLPARDFFSALAKLRLEGIVPKGTGKFVHGPLQKDLFN
ncbi:restriction endonuclease subunit S [Shinella yambaruensis]|uniref:Type I restriction modification DNA specificity domain-containing protein n=1 Tax=Shinella yambaruensis TaxID=415996 RepID=A0ABQ5ZT12_9HYPH|nr:restriction endonuclease subunit S [Shinella yambaruensis]MCJ8027912.1 restriction endonuclease subunit S [Shinella yambaruensis]MCU7979982.1 restriction endonuclease subunit S [Shinella yambaruensis]GLR55266.1 hypothetical protein GCM10007923_64890 [Shinella yambaruensis]